MVSTASKGLAESLKGQLSEGNLKAIRKALTPLAITICAMELAIGATECGDESLEDQTLLIMGTELVKVYTSSRWDDVRHLDAEAMSLPDHYWGERRRSCRRR